MSTKYDDETYDQVRLFQITRTTDHNCFLSNIDQIKCHFMFLSKHIMLCQRRITKFQITESQNLIFETNQILLSIVRSEES